MGRLQGFSISREEEVLGLTYELVDEGKEETRYSILGKVPSRRIISVGYFQRAFWSAVEQREADDN